MSKDNDFFGLSPRPEAVAKRERLIKVIKHFRNVEFGSIDVANLTELTQKIAGCYVRDLISLGMAKIVKPQVRAGASSYPTVYAIVNDDCLINAYVSAHVSNGKNRNDNPDHFARVLKYDQETGLFTWIGDRCRLAKSGQPAGTLGPFGYVQITLFSRHYRAHRLAWFMTYGVWPDGDVDHINGNRSDNRIANLRVVTRTQNAQNRSAYSNNKSGLLGVSKVWNCNKYRAKISINGVDNVIGYFETPEEAHAAYVKAKKEHHIGGRIDVEMRANQKIIFNAAQHKGVK